MGVAIFGRRFYGYCDEIEGLGHVETKFFHVNFVPLMPLESFFIFHPLNEDENPQVQSIPISRTSIRKAFLLSFFLVMAWALFLVYLWTELTKGWVAGLAILCVAAFFEGRKWKRTATYERAKEIVEHELFRPSLLERVNIVYGRSPLSISRQYQDRSRVVASKGPRSAVCHEGYD